MKLSSRKNRIPTKRNPKHWIKRIVRVILKKEYCKICGQELTEIRGRYPKQPKRKVCACCATEKLENQEATENTKTFSSAGSGTYSFKPKI
jgi:threonine dehydrogenase-like Zn-dependent dehydrogenase